MNKQNLQKGFTLLETLLAASILAMVVTGTIALSNTSLRRSADSLERVVAMNLSREAIELLRASRDSTYIDEKLNSWSDPLGGDNPQFESVYQLTALEDGSGGYSLSGGQGGDGEIITLDGDEYTRKIYIENPSFDYADLAGLPSGVDEDRLIRFIRVEVSWGAGDRQKIETRALFTDWRFGV